RAGPRAAYFRSSKQHPNLVVALTCGALVVAGAGFAVAAGFDVAAGAAPVDLGPAAPFEPCAGAVVCAGALVWAGALVCAAAGVVTDGDGSGTGEGAVVAGDGSGDGVGTVIAGDAAALDPAAAAPSTSGFWFFERHRKKAPATPPAITTAIAMPARTGPIVDG